MLKKLDKTHIDARKGLEEVLGNATGPPNILLVEINPNENGLKPLSHERSVANIAEGAGNHLLASLGIVYPLVMKSPFFRISFPEFEKRLCRLSLLPTTLRRLFRSCSSSRTLAVNIAVPAFLIPLGTGAVSGVDVPLSTALLEAGSGLDVRGIDVGLGFDAVRSDGAVSLELVASLPFFFRFLVPGAFFRE